MVTKSFVDMPQFVKYGNSRNEYVIPTDRLNHQLHMATKILFLTRRKKVILLAREPVKSKVENINHIANINKNINNYYACGAPPNEFLPSLQKYIFSVKINNINRIILNKLKKRSRIIVELFLSQISADVETIKFLES